MQVLKNASRIANKAKLAKANTEVFSAYPVFESEFWETIYKAAKQPKTAPEVLQAMQAIQEEPCIENDRVFRCVSTAITHAKLALLN